MIKAGRTSGRARPSKAREGAPVTVKDWTAAADALVSSRTSPRSAERVGIFCPATDRCDRHRNFDDAIGGVCILALRSRNIRKSRRPRSRCKRILRGRIR